MKNLFIFSSVLSAFISVLNCSFEKSLEDEFHEIAQYYFIHKKHEIEEILPNIQSPQDFINAMLADPDLFLKRHHQDDLTTFSDLMGRNGWSDCDKQNAKDIKTTFEYLKKKMNLSQEIDLMYCLGIMAQLEPKSGATATMFYSWFERTIYMKPLIFHFTPPSCRLFTMIHELMHVRQHMRDGLLQMHLKANNELLAAELEHEADSNAAEFIKCPLCMKVIYACSLIDPSEDDHPQDESERLKYGYLGSDQFKNFLQQKSLNDLCKVHKSIENPDIWSGLDTQEGLKQIMREDFNLSSMLDRLI